MVPIALLAPLLSREGNAWPKTPSMDGPAAAGVRFERAYCSNLVPPA